MESARRSALGAGIAIGVLPKEFSGLSITSIFGKMDLTRAAGSKNAKSFCAKFKLPPSHYMKDAAAEQSFRAARRKFVADNQNTP